VTGTGFQHVFTNTFHKPESAASQGNAAEEGEKGKKTHLNAWRTSIATYTLAIFKR